MINTALEVQLKDSSYPIFIAHALLSDKWLWNSILPHSKVMIITDDQVAPLYLNTVREALSPREVHLLVLKAGESSKNIREFEKIIDALVQHSFHRDSSIIALGGGVITDIAGFAAACYLRGIHFIQAPTTLLAQVDAAIGGKTAINHTQAKNLVGCFYQPKAVVIDLDTLNSLPEREFRSGIAEMIKMAVSLDASFFNYLEENMPLLLAKDPEVLQTAIKRCCEIKAEIVQADEKEAGLRAILNFGHTIGHALEHYGNYSDYLHGEAVALGMIVAAEFSVKHGGLHESHKNRLIQLIQKAELPDRLPSPLNYDKLMAALSQDKKYREEQLHVIILTEIGHALVKPINPAELATLAAKIIHKET